MRKTRNLAYEGCSCPYHRYRACDVKALWLVGRRHFGRLESAADRLDRVDLGPQRVRAVGDDFRNVPRLTERGGNGVLDDDGCAVHVFSVGVWDCEVT